MVDHATLPNSTLALDEDEIDWLDEFADESDLVPRENVSESIIASVKEDQMKFQRVNQAHNSVTTGFRSLKQGIRFGWPALQIDVLKECIELAEGSEGRSRNPTP